MILEGEKRRFSYVHINKKVVKCKNTGNLDTPRKRKQKQPPGSLPDPKQRRNLETNHFLLTKKCIIATNHNLKVKIGIEKKKTDWWRNFFVKSERGNAIS